MLISKERKKLFKEVEEKAEKVRDFLDLNKSERLKRKREDQKNSKINFDDWCKNQGIDKYGNKVLNNKKNIEMTEKNYIKCWAKERKFDNGGSIIALSINIEELSKLPVDKYGNVKVDLCQRREAGKYGETHYLVENTYNKEGETQEQKDKQAEQEAASDLPFN